MDSSTSSVSAAIAVPRNCNICQEQLATPGDTCRPCKKFYAKYRETGVKNNCKNNGLCAQQGVPIKTCTYCRFQKCCTVGIASRARRTVSRAQSVNYEEGLDRAIENPFPDLTARLDQSASNKRTYQQSVDWSGQSTSANPIPQATEDHQFKRPFDPTPRQFIPIDQMIRRPPSLSPGTSTASTSSSPDLNNLGESTSGFAHPPEPKRGRVEVEDCRRSGSYRKILDDLRSAEAEMKQAQAAQAFADDFSMLDISDWTGLNEDDFKVLKAKVGDFDDKFDEILMNVIVSDDFKTIPNAESSRNLITPMDTIKEEDVKPEEWKPNVLVTMWNSNDLLNIPTLEDFKAVATVGLSSDDRFTCSMKAFELSISGLLAASLRHPDYRALTRDTKMKLLYNSFITIHLLDGIYAKVNKLVDNFYYMTTGLKLKYEQIVMFDSDIIVKQCSSLIEILENNGFNEKKYRYLRTLALFDDVVFDQPDVKNVAKRTQKAYGPGVDRCKALLTLLKKKSVGFACSYLSHKEKLIQAIRLPLLNEMTPNLKNELIKYK